MIEYYRMLPFVFLPRREMELQRIETAMKRHTMLGIHRHLLPCRVRVGL